MSKTEQSGSINTCLLFINTEVNTQRMNQKSWRLFFGKEMEPRVLGLLFFWTNLVGQVNSLCEWVILAKTKPLKKWWVLKDKTVTARVAALGAWLWKGADMGEWVEKDVDNMGVLTEEVREQGLVRMVKIQLNEGDWRWGSGRGDGWSLLPTSVGTCLRSAEQCL